MKVAKNYITRYYIDSGTNQKLQSNVLLDTELKGLRKSCNKEPYSNRPEMDTLLTTSFTYVTEGKGQSQQTSMITTDSYRPDYIALRTIPVILRNGDRSLGVNALLDNVSTKNYIFADVADVGAELGLQGKTEKVMVNVLNGKVEASESKPVEFQLESINGSVNMTFNAYTANRATGDMRVFDWNKCISHWPYLKNIDFPHSLKREILDLLIGLDCAYLHSTIEEVRGKPSKPIARGTPLGWTCVGNPGQRDGSMLQTNFASTFFVKDQSSLERLKAKLKQIMGVLGGAANAGTTCDSIGGKTSLTNSRTLYKLHCSKYLKEHCVFCH